MMLMIYIKIYNHFNKCTKEYFTKFNIILKNKTRGRMKILQADE